MSRQEAHLLWACTDTSDDSSNQAIWEQRFMEMDWNGDGTIHFKEFLMAFESWHSTHKHHSHKHSAASHKSHTDSSQQSTGESCASPRDDKSSEVSHTHVSCGPTESAAEAAKEQHHRHPTHTHKDSPLDHKCGDDWFYSARMLKTERSLVVSMLSGSRWNSRNCGAPMF
ncbi:unnamed protein product [Phytophthora lilii]|uniref:Unnamed protein product n=1 Tax=Phytophthora lilii TaxID=2077276 RepID=A0A9W6WJ75_9STRA|nr:unnamed protein product [Phytophthora lilii]